MLTRALYLAVLRRGLRIFPWAISGLWSQDPFRVCGKGVLKTWDPSCARNRAIAHGLPYSSSRSRVRGFARVA
jgi:hypothetical protein